jgi:hypothetical protein
MNTTHSIDEAISLFTSKIQSAVQNNTFLNQSKNPFKLPPEIAQEISAKNRLRRDWQRTHDPAIKRQLNHKIAFIRLVLRTHKQDEWDKFMTTLDTNDNSIFKLNKKLLNKAPASHPLSGPTGLIYSAADKAELFADIFQTQFSPNPGPDLPEVNTNIQTIRHTPILNSLFISPGTLAQYIKRLPNRKAPGQDTISNAALKNIPPKGIVMLTNIFNGCLRLGYFPSAWKTGIIITIPKAGKDHNLPVNHRPITLLSSVSKLLERVVLKFLLDAVGRKIRHEQFAFRSNHSTSLQLVNVIDHLCLKANNKEKTAAVFLDVEKAFDRVWHDGLLHKLHVLGTPIQITKMVDSFLGNRFFTVRNDNCFSSTRPILAGVPQGSCLSPLLYTVYTNDIPVNQNSSVTLFADDTLYHTSNRNCYRAISHLQSQVNAASHWFKQWRLKLNAQKTVAVCFNQQNTSKFRRIHLDGHQINWSNSAKYLGVLFDKDLHFHLHVRETLKKATRVRGILYPILNKKSPVPAKTKLQMLHMYVRSVIAYAGQAWAPLISQSNWNKLETIQNIGLRTILSAPPYIRNRTLLDSTATTSIQDHIRKNARVMFIKNSFSDHQHLRQLGRSITPTILNKRQRPFEWSNSEQNQNAVKA